MSEEVLFDFDFFLTIGCPRRTACVVAAEAAGIRSTEVDFGVDGWWMMDLDLDDCWVMLGLVDGVDQ